MIARLKPSAPREGSRAPGERPRAPRERRRVALVAIVALPMFAIMLSAPHAVRADVPSRLSDREFWRLSTESSEADGYFRSDNLTSNEMLYQHVIPNLLAPANPGAVYLVVGPHQNLTY